MSLDNTILKIRREYSGNEKYRLFLKHLDNVESELKQERLRLTDRLKELEGCKQKNAELKKDNATLRYQVEQLTAELGEYKATEQDKKFVRMKAYKRLDQSKTMWETRFWELHRQFEELKQSKLHNNETQP